MLTFSISSRAKETMQPYITQYNKAGSLYYTDDWFAYAFLPIRGNHVALLKEKGIPPEVEITLMSLKDPVLYQALAVSISGHSQGLFLSLSEGGRERNLTTAMRTWLSC